MLEINETDEARIFLIDFMGKHFKNKHFGNYIAHSLSGDFAYNLAMALKKTDNDKAGLVEDSDGIKYDSGKPRFELLPLSPIEEVVKVLTFGAKKYDDENWRKVPDGKRRYFGALMRHIFAYFKGEKVDSETGLSHLAHAICCLIFIMEIDK